MNEEVERLRNAIRKHRDERGDDRCWLSDEELYRVLPEGYTPPERDTSVELQMCENYIRCRHNPATVYVSPQRRIEELEAELTRWRRVGSTLIRTHDLHDVIGEVESLTGVTGNE